MFIAFKTIICAAVLTILATFQLFLWHGGFIGLSKVKSKKDFAKWWSEPWRQFLFAECYGFSLGFSCAVLFWIVV